MRVMDGCPGSARPKWTLVRCVNSISKQWYLGSKMTPQFSGLRYIIYTCKKKKKLCIPSCFDTQNVSSNDPCYSCVKVFHELKGVKFLVYSIVVISLEAFMTNKCRDSCDVMTYWNTGHVLLQFSLQCQQPPTNIFFLWVKLVWPRTVSSRPHSLEMNGPGEGKCTPCGWPLLPEGVLFSRTVDFSTQEMVWECLTSLLMGRDLTVDLPADLRLLWQMLELVIIKSCCITWRRRPRYKLQFHVVRISLDSVLTFHPSYNMYFV